MRAISAFNREAGISTFACLAWTALRIRVSISATGSFMVPLDVLPARLYDSGYFPRKRQLPETNTAQIKFPQETPRPAATFAAAVIAHGVFLLRCFLGNCRSSSHSSPLVSCES